MWRDVSGTVGGGGSNGRWTVVSSDSWTIEESGLDELDETRVEVDLDVSYGVLDHPDRLEEKVQMIY